ncbi:hypothetical protein E2C01_027884 [Portunus trituberculatus]|uniref:Uncharacterized protein n=1 Tax=Portunus trituberculatus TaxID=210409 RepID=A0A5B7EJU7_PORTR|nr:hypothetical protein [Portunus trituberculatus]
MCYPGRPNLDWCWLTGIQRYSITPGMRVTPDHTPLRRPRLLPPLGSPHEAQANTKRLDTRNADHSSGAPPSGLSCLLFGRHLPAPPLPNTCWTTLYTSLRGSAVTCHISVAFLPVTGECSGQRTQGLLRVTDCVWYNPFLHSRRQEESTQRSGTTVTSQQSGKAERTPSLRHFHRHTAAPR